MAIHILEELKTSGAFTVQKGILTVPNDVDGLEPINTNGIQLGTSSSGFQLKTTSGGSAYLKGTSHVELATSNGYVQVGQDDNSAYLKVQTTGVSIISPGGGDTTASFGGTISFGRDVRVGYNPNDGSDACLLYTSDAADE